MSLTVAVVTADEVIEVVIEVLAAAEERRPEEVMAELTATGGPELVIDSLRIVEILTRVEERFEVHLPASPAIARSTRSVLTFAQAVVDAIEEEARHER